MMGREIQQIIHETRRGSKKPVVYPELNMESGHGLVMCQESG